MNEADFQQATDSARLACEHIAELNRATRLQENQIPAHTAEQLGDLASLTAALPQTFSQLANILAQALARQQLRMDGSGTTDDPAMAVGVARLHLDEARGLAVELHKRIDAAHQVTAQIISDGSKRNVLPLRGPT